MSKRFKKAALRTEEAELCTQEQVLETISTFTHFVVTEMESGADKPKHGFVELDTMKSLLSRAPASQFSSVLAGKAEDGSLYMTLYFSFFESLRSEDDTTEKKKKDDAEEDAEEGDDGSDYYSDPDAGTERAEKEVLRFLQKADDCRNPELLGKVKLMPVHVLPDFS